MIILLIVLLVLAVLVVLVIGGFTILEEGLPAADSDILELLSTKQTEYYIDKDWNDNFKLRSRSYETPDIHKTSFGNLLFPYYISNVGVVPFWYKSTKVLNQMFKDKIQDSKYKITKREKLGLK